MANNRLILPMEEMVPLITAAVGADASVEMTVTGNSMRPLLKDRVSSVKLVRASDVKKGDIVLFYRSDGKYVLHRVVRVHDGVYDISGDNQRATDRNIPEDALIAKVAAFNRKGKRWATDDAAYRKVLPIIKAVKYNSGRIKRKLRSIIG